MTRRDLGNRTSPVDRAHMERPEVPLTPDEDKNPVLFSLAFENHTIVCARDVNR